MLSFKVCFFFLPPWQRIMLYRVFFWLRKKIAAPYKTSKTSERMFYCLSLILSFSLFHPHTHTHSHKIKADLTHHQTKAFQTNCACPRGFSKTKKINKMCIEIDFSMMVEPCRKPASQEKWNIAPTQVIPFYWKYKEWDDASEDALTRELQTNWGRDAFVCLLCSSLLFSRPWDLIWIIRFWCISLTP